MVNNDRTQALRHRFPLGGEDKLFVAAPVYGGLYVQFSEDAQLWLAVEENMTVIVPEEDVLSFCSLGGVSGKEFAKMRAKAISALAQGERHGTDKMTRR